MPEDKPKRMGSRGLLRMHFLNNIGKVMHSDELREVAGIREWARRVRELRNEEGYPILTHNDRSDLKPGEYLLESPKPQPGAIGGTDTRPNRRPAAHLQREAGAQNGKIGQGSRTRAKIGNSTPDLDWGAFPNYPESQASRSYSDANRRLP